MPHFEHMLCTAKQLLGVADADMQSHVERVDEETTVQTSGNKKCEQERRWAE
jgi:hypothetical protein